jgi:DNA recombination protein RmuC
MLTNILLALIVFLLAVLIYVFLRKQHNDSQGLELTLLRAWSDLQLDEKVGRIESYAKAIRDDYKALDQMLRVPKERSDLSETALECILDDQLPANLFGIRRQVLNGKTPDAYIQSPVGLICIDSKFPLDNYRKMLNANGSQDSERSKKQFIANVKDHLKKIATDYVCPEAGSAEFAFAYVHSEGVYWFLIAEAGDMLRSFAKEGV